MKPHGTASLARADLADVGMTVIKDDAMLRQRVVDGYTGSYASYYDEEVNGIVIILKSTVRRLLAVER